jgi:NADP-dependent 3-hydroxy acid dehydrogenase YdfG
VTGDSLAGSTCLVTGASGGIGGAIAVSLEAHGATVWAVGRRREALEAMAALGTGAGRFELCEADLVVDERVARLAQEVTARGHGLDVLVHAAGAILMGDLEAASVDDLDRQYAINVRASYLLTSTLLPALRASRGQVVFINSSAGLTARARTGLYAASKHALKAIADSLRDEVNADGLRVVSVFPGRTATRLQAEVHSEEGKPYRPEDLAQPADVASVVLNALTMPRTAEVTDVMVRPRRKPAAGAI